MQYLDKENFDFISQNIDQVIQETLSKFKIEEHYKLETDFLKKESKKVEGNSLNYFINFSTIYFFQENMLI